MICDEYFNTGIPFHFSPRQLLKKQLARLKQQKYGLTVGLEVEWYLLRIADDRLAPDNIGQIGIKGKPTRVTAVEPGYSYHSESNFDIMQPVLTASPSISRQSTCRCARSKTSGGRARSNAPLLRRMH